jgi:hypothetical protein
VRRRRYQAAATVLAIVGLVAGTVWLDHWTLSPPIAPATSTPLTELRCPAFVDPSSPGLRPRGKPVLIT